MNGTHKYLAYIWIIRPLNLFITFMAVIVSAIICSAGEMNYASILFAALSAALSAASGNVINDFFDAGPDKINRPQRPIPSGKISLKAASVYYLFLLILSLAFAAMVNLFAVIIVLFAGNLLFIYSYRLKRIPLVGNIVVSFLTGLAFIYGGIVVFNPLAAIIPAVFAFFITLIREIVKDMEDIKGDKSAGVITFPGKYNSGATRLLLLVLAAVLIIFTTYPYFSHSYSIEFFITVMLTVNLLLVYIIHLLFKDDSQKNLRKVSNMLKAGMVFGLIAIYLGK